YSVIQIGTVRCHHSSSESSNFGSWVSVTFGQRTRCVGGRFGAVAYGWCDHASKRSTGRWRERSWANLPGDSVSCVPARPSTLSRPRAEVSPIPTRARELPDL